jgi:hypothetical protein
MSLLTTHCPESVSFGQQCTKTTTSFAMKRGAEVTGFMYCLLKQEPAEKPIFFDELSVRSTQI